MRLGDLLESCLSWFTSTLCVWLQSWWSVATDFKQFLKDTSTFFPNAICNSQVRKILVFIKMLLGIFLIYC